MKTTTTTKVTTVIVAVLTKDWTFNDHGGRYRTFPVGKELQVPGDALLLPNGELRWADHTIPQDHFELHEDETTSVTTSTTVRNPLSR